MTSMGRTRDRRHRNMSPDWRGAALDRIEWKLGMAGARYLLDKKEGPNGGMKHYALAV